MAAAIIPLVTTAVSAIAPQIPSVVTLVEGLFGHSSTTKTQDGPAKMETAVQMLTAALEALANSGKIPSAPVVDPNLTAGLAGPVQQTVDSLKAQGQLGPPAVAQTGAKASPKTVSAPAATSPAGGMKVTITGLMTAGEAAS